MNISPAAAALAALVVAGCAVGPDFTRPSVPKTDSYGEASRATRLTGDGAAQSLQPGVAVDPTWWTLFQAPALDQLVTAGLRNSPTLAAARAALEEGHEQARAGAGVFFPRLDGAADAEREQAAPLRLGQAGKPSTFNLYTVTGTVDFGVDLFGGQRRGVEALVAAADRQRYAMGAAWLTLTGNIVDTAIARAGYAGEVDVLRDIVRLDAAQRDMLQAQVTAGYGPLSAVLQVEQVLSADRESLATASQREAAARTLLQALIGGEAGAPPLPAPSLADLTVPEAAPVSLPAEIVRQRPDILEAEAALHQASAQVGVATAALLPSISITGDYGAASLSIGKLGSPQGVFWGIGPAVNIPVFQGGALWFGRRAAQAALRAAQATYRQTVLTALEQTADCLKALDTDAEVAGASRGAFDAATLDEALASVNRRAGVIAGYDEMSLDIAAERARLGLIAARSQRLQDVVALYLASGGGWNARGAGPGAVAAK